MKKIALLGCSKEEESLLIKEYSQHPKLKEWLKEQSEYKTSDGRIILPEDRLLIAALAKEGIQAESVAWSDEKVSWSQYALCIVRTVWFWHIYPEKFFNFIENLSLQTKIWNSVEVMRWGSNKKYLLELAKKGTAVIPSILIPAKSDIIFKPCVSQGARDIFRLSSIDNFPKILDNNDIIIQPYLDLIESKGEISVVVLDGKITHAVKRLPVEGGFLAIGYPITEEFLYPMDDTIINLTENILSKIEYKINFARLDFIYVKEEELLFSEIEIIAPRLFLQYSEFAITTFVKLIKEALK